MPLLWENKKNGNMENKTFIHYGSSAFDKKRFLRIQTPHHNDKKLAFKKPWGGLWASPL